MNEEKSQGLEKLSRRRMLKRVGAGAAIAWSAPILSSLRTPAFAAYPTRCEVCAAECGISVGEPGGPCLCFEDVDGNQHCTNNFFCGGGACTSNDDCVNLFGIGFFCQTGTGCGGLCGQVCAPECGINPPPEPATEGAQTNA